MYLWSFGIFSTNWGLGNLGTQQVFASLNNILGSVKMFQTKNKIARSELKSIYVRKRFRQAILTK